MNGKKYGSWMEQFKLTKVGGESNALVLLAAWVPHWRAQRPHPHTLSHPAARVPPQFVTPALGLENTTTHELFGMPDFSLQAAAPPADNILPEGVEPSPLLPAEVQAAVRAARGDAPTEEAVAVGADGGVSPGGSTGFQHKLDDGPLTWVDVPTEAVAAWLESYFLGRLRPVGVTVA